MSSARVRVMPIVVGNATVHLVERRDGGGGGGDSGYFLVAADVRLIADLQESTFYSVQKIALDKLDEAAHADAVVSSRTDDVAALLAVGALDAGASHCRLVSLDMAKAMMSFLAAPLASSDLLQVTNVMCHVAQLQICRHNVD
jgi:hypothetical protein